MSGRIGSSSTSNPAEIAVAAPAPACRSGSSDCLGTGPCPARIGNRKTAELPARMVRGVVASCLRQRRVDISRRSSVSDGPRSAITAASTVLRQARRSAARARHADKARRTCSKRPALEGLLPTDDLGDVNSVVWFVLVTDMFTSLLVLISRSRSIEHLCI